MLSELRISRLAIVDELHIPFAQGLTVLTGETGAGKSLLAGALGLLCGAPVPKELVRLGEESAFVEGVFDLSEAPRRREALARLGVRLGADGILVLRRELRLQGRNRVLINGLVSSLAMLERIGPSLLTIQSQDQQRELIDPNFARGFLDELVGLGELRRRLRRAWDDHRRAVTAYEERTREAQLHREQVDLWRYQHAELERASLQVNEAQELAERLTVARNATALQSAAAAAWELLAGREVAAREGVGEAIAALRGAAAKSRQLGDIMVGLQAVESALSDTAAALERFLDRLEADPGALEELEGRKALYEELHRKYRRDTAGLLAWRDELAARIRRQDGADTELAALRDARDQACQVLTDVAAELHQRRSAGAPEVARSVEREARPLALPHLEIDFRVEPRHAPDGPISVAGSPCQVGPDGPDRVELLIRTNPGERIGPASTIASGGERSRIHLALAVLRRAAEEPPLLLCDEVDAGLGMDAALPVASLLRRLSRGGQVVCITHLPTVAVFGDSHLKVAKRVRAGRADLSVASLDGDERLQEIMRLLGGGQSGATVETRRRYAEELLRQAAVG